MEARLLYRGRVWSLYLLKEGEREFAREFVERDLTDVQRTQIRNLLTRVAYHGLPARRETYRVLHGHANLVEFKRGEVRLLCFFDGPGRIVLVHGFKKKSDRTPPQEIERALRLRDAYLAEKEQSG